MGLIYKAENSINGMIYIGKTTKSLKLRKQDHINKSMRLATNTRFHNAIRSYGPENFDWFVLERCKNDLLNEREEYYISLYDSFNKTKGYNMTAGGDNDPKCNLGRKYSKKHRENMSKARKGIVFSSEHKKNISKAQKKRYIEDPSSLKILQKKYHGCNKRKIKQFSKLGIFIKEWDSILLAGEAFGTHPSNISRACRGETRTSAGYIWKFVEDDITEYDIFIANSKKTFTEEHKYKIGEVQQKAVNQYNTTNRFIRSWSSAKVAGEDLGIYPSGITRCCQGKYKKCGGFIWKYADEHLTNRN